MRDELVLSVAEFKQNLCHSTKEIQLFYKLNAMEQQLKQIEHAAFKICGVSKKKFRESKVMASLVGGPGVKPLDAREFAKSCKRFLQKMAKKHYFSLFFKRISKLWLNLCAFGRKTQLVGKLLRKL